MSFRSLILPLALVGACDAPVDTLDGPTLDAAALEGWDLPVDQAAPPLPRDLVLDVDRTLEPGVPATFRVTGLTPGEVVSLARGEALTGDICPAGLGGGCVDIGGAVQLLGQQVADGGGEATFTLTPPSIAPFGAETVFQAGVRRGPGGADSVISNVARVRISDGSARLRVIHASHDAPAVDVYANGALVAAGLSYKDATGYLSVPADTYVVDLRAAGADPASPPVFTETLTLSADTDYTAVAAGFFSLGGPAVRFRILPVVDTWGDPTSETYQANIIHASPTANGVSIDVGVDGTDEIVDQARWTTSGAVALPSAGLRVNVIDFFDTPTEAFSLPPFAPGEEVAVLASGLFRQRPNEPDGFGLLAVTRDGSVAFVQPDPKVYVLHASPNAPAVDVRAGGDVLVDDLDYREVSAPVQVPAGIYTLDVTDASGSTTVATWDTPLLEAGQRYLVTAAGDLPTPGSTGNFTLIPWADLTDLPSGDVTIDVLHASGDAGPVDVGIIDPASGGFLPAFGTLAFTESSAAFSPAGVYETAVAAPGSLTPLFVFPPLDLPADSRTLAIATGSVGADFGATIIDLDADAWEAVTVFPVP